MVGFDVTNGYRWNWGRSKARFRSVRSPRATPEKTDHHHFFSRKSPRPHSFFFPPQKKKKKTRDWLISVFVLYMIAPLWRNLAIRYWRYIWLTRRKSEVGRDLFFFFWLVLHVEQQTLFWSIRSLRDVKSDSPPAALLYFLEAGKSCVMRLKMRTITNETITVDVYGSSFQTAIWEQNIFSVGIFNMFYVIRPFRKKNTNRKYLWPRLWKKKKGTAVPKRSLTPFSYLIFNIRLSSLPFILG